jgi:hypothetical protein
MISSSDVVDARSHMEVVPDNRRPSSSQGILRVFRPTSPGEKMHGEEPNPGAATKSLADLLAEKIATAMAE